MPCCRNHSFHFKVVYKQNLFLKFIFIDLLMYTMFDILKICLCGASSSSLGQNLSRILYVLVYVRRHSPSLQSINIFHLGSFEFRLRRSLSVFKGFSFHMQHNTLNTCFFKRFSCFLLFPKSLSRYLLYTG